MSRRDLARVAAAILAGLGIALLPFLQYGVRSHSHDHHGAGVAQVHEQHHHQHPHEGDEP